MWLRCFFIESIRLTQATVPGFFYCGVGTVNGWINGNFKRLTCWPLAGGDWINRIFLGGRGHCIPTQFLIISHHRSGNFHVYVQLSAVGWIRSIVLMLNVYLSMGKGQMRPYQIIREPSSSFGIFFFIGSDFTETRHRAKGNSSLPPIL